MQGVVFLATNRPFDLDEAMHRRITAVYEYKPPDHLQRRRIWQLLARRVPAEASRVVQWRVHCVLHRLGRPTCVLLFSAFVTAPRLPATRRVSLSFVLRAVARGKQTDGGGVSSTMPSNMPSNNVSSNVPSIV